MTNPIRLFFLYSRQKARPKRLVASFSTYSSPGFINITSGIGHFNIESKDKLLTLLIFDPLDPPVAINETLDQDVNHTNVISIPISTP